MKPTTQELFGPAGMPRVVVVGAGFGGIAAGVKMKRAGIDTFTIYESSLGIGGTWWDNTYPGAEVDVGSHLYCFSFKPHHWTRTHARQPELQKYLEETVDEFGLRPHLRLGVTVESATWDDDRHVWTVRLDDGTVDECHVLVSGVGFLNVPRYPDWPGLESFAGPKFHTARWEHGHDLTGKVVAVVGTGSSATQIVPAIQPMVKHLYVFQREPGWVLPKGEKDFTDEQRAQFVRWWPRTRERWRLRWLLEKNLWSGNLQRPGTKANRAREELCRSYIDRKFADRPDLREAVTPTYPYPGKRPVLASTYYSALKQPNVELVPRAVTAVTPGGIVGADGVERAADVIVMATGFQPANYLARLRVVGRRGRTLQEHWADEPRAFLGITVSGFPNFFMLYGPGTNGGDIVSMLEAQAEYAVRAVTRMRRERVTAVEVRPRFEAAWYRWLQSKMAGTSWAVSNNYFKSPTGKVVTQWPYGNSQYVVMTKLLGRVSETTRRRIP
ncbi:MAG: NAD(P)/FAD-dependent oxidoreductase [Actinobacteria bacterium]|nr:NAD(P)/FAD-dependent oxidoreductase [Actinomycetota bacterium]